jgi:hypothetical protein
MMMPSSVIDHEEGSRTSSLLAAVALETGRSIQETQQLFEQQQQQQVATLRERDRRLRENGWPGLWSVELEGQFTGYERVHQELMQTHTLPFLTPSKRSNDGIIMRGLNTWEDSEMADAEEGEEEEVEFRSC